MTCNGHTAHNGNIVHRSENHTMVSGQALILGSSERFVSADVDFIIERCFTLDDLGSTYYASICSDSTRVH